MYHEIYTVTDFEMIAPHTLRIQFDDGRVQVINFVPMLRGELYGPLRELHFFNQVRLDPESGTLVWPNEADFDPATLHDWDRVGEAMIKMAESWPEPLENHNLQRVMTVTYLEERAKRAKRERFEQLLSKVPDVEPEDDDKLD